MTAQSETPNTNEPLEGQLVETREQVWERIGKTARTTLIVQGVLGIIMGAVMLFMPWASLFALSIVLGAWVLVSGVTTIIHHFSRDKAHRSGWVLASGILSALAGLVLLVLPGSAVMAMVYVMVFWALLLGITTVIDSFQARRLGASAWWTELVAGIVAIALGVLIIFVPAAALLTMVWSIGIYAIVAGIASIALAIRLRRAKNNA